MTGNRPIFLTLSLALGLGLGSCVTPMPEPDHGFGDYVSGQFARSISDTSRAADYYYKALQSAPDSRAILQEAFSLAIMDGHHEMALDLAGRLKAAGYPNTVASMILSLDHFRTGRFDAALADLGDAKGTGFDSLVSPLVKAWIEARRGNIDEALSALEPLDAVAVFKIYRRAHAAYILDYGGREEAAEAAYKVLMTDRGVSVQSILAYGEFMRRNGRALEAEKFYRGQFEKAPGTIRLARALDRSSGLPATTGRQPGPELMTSTPEGAIAFVLLRASSQLSADNARTPAILYARLATFLKPQFDEANLLLGNMFMAFRQPKTALAAFAHIPDHSPFSDVARIREAVAKDDLGQTDEAIRTLQLYLETDSENKLVRTTLGDIRRGQEDYEGALAEYERVAVDADAGVPSPDDWFLYFARGICYERLGLWAKAEADFKLSLELRPEEPQVMNYLGYSWIDRGENIEEAQVLIRAAVDQRPNDGFIVDSLGWVQYLLGQYDAAVASLERAVLLEPDDPTINDHLGDAYWQVGRHLEARFQWNHALTVGAEEDRVASIEDKIAYGLGIPLRTAHEQTDE